MKILLLSDVPSKALWDFYQPERLDGIDLIISCGDLKRDYLEFLVTMRAIPLLYVPGNHDTAYVKDPPGGCQCIDGKLVRFHGLRIIGFGGSPFYSPGPFQYTEEQMTMRIRRASLQLMRARGADLIVAHAAIAGCGDAPDFAHRGFECFGRLVEKWKPRYFVHGHVHLNYGAAIPRVRRFGETTVINAYERCVLELPEGTVR